MAITSTARRPYTLYTEPPRPPFERSEPRQRVDPAAAEADRQVRATFTELAKDRDGFHALMKEVYGPDHDRAAAETLRQRTLSGDHSWMPEIKVLDPGSFPPGGMGAYAEGVVYLNRQALADPALAKSVLMEELGHHIDTFVKDVDTAGDEGEMFRRLVAGEKLSEAQKASIRAENDRGTITVDGKTVEVEFFLKKAWNGIKRAASAVGNAVGSVVDGVVSAGRGVVEGVVNLGRGIANGVGEAWQDLRQGRIFSAAGSLVGGVLNGVGNAGSSILNGAVRGVQGIVEAPTHLFGGAGAWVRDNITDRLFTAADRGLQGLWRTGVGVAQSLVEGATTVGDGLQSVLMGRFGEGFSQIGRGLVQTFVQTPVDAALLGLGSVLSAAQIAIGVENKGRGLTDAELNHMRSVFGESVDLSQVRVVEGRSGLFGVNDRPFVHGNTIYMKDVRSLDVLTHEMVHVWQFQNGGPDYMSEALWSQQFGRGYDWEPSVPHTPWAQLEPEQQAEMIEQASRQGFFTPGHPNEGTFFWDIRGDGRLVDLTDYLEEAVRQMRAGRGAP